MDAGNSHVAPIPGEGETVKRIRKGTKSCVECRHRKIRCVWHSAQDVVCAGCKVRGRDCVPQLYRRTTNAPKLSAKDRISRLEQQIANLTSAATREENRPTSSDMSPHQESLDEDEDVSSDDGLSNDFSNDRPAAEGPVHLQFLFDSGRISQKDEEHETYLSQARCSKRYLDQARMKLQRLLPSRDAVQATANYATPWMSIYRSLFPATTSINTKEELLSQYELASDANAHPVNIAMVLLVWTVTVLQVPDEAVKQMTGRDRFSLARGVVHTVEHTIVSHNGLAITVEGIECTLMFLRLKLSLGGVRSLWIALRRTISLAELIGLPRAWHLKDKAESTQVHSPTSTTSSTRDRLTQKAGLWQAICATDRLASLMFNLPAATAMHKFPPKRVISPEGEILPREYMFELATLALSVQELDEAYALEQSHDEVYERVLSRDRHLRSIKRSIPKAWWTEYESEFSAVHLTRFWHHYLTLRVHLPWALKEDGDEYAYSRTVCTEASEETCRRYSQLRRDLPGNFFICRIIDMQVFTAAVFLVLSDIKQQQQSVNAVQQQPVHMDLVGKVLETWNSLADGLNAPFLKEGTSAVQSLIAILRDPSSHGAGQNLSLRIPLLGKVRFGRQEPRTQQLRPANLAQIPEQTVTQSAGLSNESGSMPLASMAQPYQQMSSATFDTTMANTMPWLMQLDMNQSSLQDPFFGGDDLGNFDMWTGMDAMPMDFSNGGMQ